MTGEQTGGSNRHVAQDADTDAHDAGIRCTSLDGHHHLVHVRWAWDCCVCGAVLRLGVWYRE